MWVVPATRAEKRPSQTEAVWTGFGPSRTLALAIVKVGCLRVPLVKLRLVEQFDGGRGRADGEQPVAHRVLVPRPDRVERATARDLQAAAMYGFHADGRRPGDSLDVDLYRAKNEPHHSRTTPVGVCRAVSVAAAPGRKAEQSQTITRAVDRRSRRRMPLDP